MAEQKSKTIASVLGEIVWLLTQSPLHKHLALSDLEWMVMPPILLNQYRIFYSGQRPVGVALWAYLNAEAEQKLMKSGARLRPDEWRAGDSAALVETLKSATRAPGAPEMPTAEGEAAAEPAAARPEPAGALWLVDLICPYATPQNKLAEVLLADLRSSVFKDKTFKYHRNDPKTGAREVVTAGAAGESGPDDAT